MTPQFCKHNLMEICCSKNPNVLALPVAQNTFWKEKTAPKAQLGAFQGGYEPKGRLPSEVRTQEEQRKTLQQ